MCCLPSHALRRRYLKDPVRVQFDGFDQHDGIIGRAVDEATGRVNETATVGTGTPICISKIIAFLALSGS